MPNSRYALWRNESSKSVADQYPYDSVGYKTFNNVLDTICCVAFKHKFVEQVNAGDIWEVDLEKNTKYPYFHCVPKDVVTNTTNLRYTFQLIIMDLVEPDESNEQQVMSDTLQILLDIIALFRNGDITKTAPDTNAVYYVDEAVDAQYTLTPFTEKFDNSVTGWLVDFTVQVDYPYPACNIPLKDDTNCVD